MSSKEQEIETKRKTSPEAWPIHSAWYSTVCCIWRAWVDCSSNTVVVVVLISPDLIYTHCNETKETAPHLGKSSHTKASFLFSISKKKGAQFIWKLVKRKKKKKRQNYLKAATDLANIRFTLAPDWAGIRLCGAITASNLLNGFVTGDGQLAAGEASLSYLTHFFDMCYKVMQQCPNANRENVLSGLSFVRSFCLPCTFFFI